jgi:hypothetical protein
VTGSDFGFVPPLKANLQMKDLRFVYEVSREKQAEAMNRSVLIVSKPCFE